MANRIKIKKGLQIPLMGVAEETVRGSIQSEYVKLCPEDFPGITPKVAARVDDRVKAGSALFYDKEHPEITFASPVSGVVTAIERGEKRRILNFTVKADAQNQYEDFGKKNVADLSADEVKNAILKAGIWWTIRQRPYDIVANPKKAPRDIFVTGFDSAPLAPDYDFILKNRIADLQSGLMALSKLTTGKLYLSIGKKSPKMEVPQSNNIVVTEFDGPHPAGNVGVQINHLAPINKGEAIWTLRLTEVAIIGKLFNEGIVDLTRTVALTGSEVKQTGYYTMTIGTELSKLFTNNVTEGINLRYISGNPLTGKRVKSDDVLRAYDSQVTVIPEGDDVHEVFGWASMSPDRYSASPLYLRLKKTYRIDARLKGGRRAFIVSNEYDKVFPMDIYPEALVKSIMAFNIDKMEQLGIYEVAPEDFALCEFVDTSKLETQKVVRTGLDLLRKEME